MTNFCEIPLTKIRTSPKNPRKKLDEEKLNELATSIKQKGVIEPIIVRPMNGSEGLFEIVAGERRFRASQKAGLAVIPAIVRELTDDEAYDFMLIENLQRDDLTDLEEAKSFQAYVKLHGEGSEAALGEKTGIRPAYIRVRVRVLALPSRVLKAWEEGRLAFAHLHQLQRVDDPDARNEIIHRLLEETQYRTISAAAVRTWVDSAAPALASAMFKTKPDCGRCASNSAVQRDLFDTGSDEKGVRCLNPACFRKHQREVLEGQWKTTTLAKKYGTTGFRFSDETGRPGARSIEPFYEWESSNFKPGKKCLGCPDFITVIELSGKVDDARACAGDKACYKRTTHQIPAREEEPDREEKPHRPDWHGEFFRDAFLWKRIEEEFGKLDPDDPKVKDLLLVCAIHGSLNRFGNAGEPAAILAKKPCDRTEAYKTVAEKIILNGDHVGGHWGQFGTKGRRLVAEYLGVDLAKEFAVDKEYLEKKTKAEILAFAKRFKLLDVRAAAKWKKPDLVKAVLDHGKKLVGKVPAEILR